MLAVSARIAACAAVLVCVLAGACKKEVPTEGRTLHFRNVPLVVDVPPRWSQTRSTPQWLMFRPDDGGALLAMSGEKDCSVVERRVFTGLIEIGLTKITWKGPPIHTEINGLPAIVAEGSALDGNKQSRVKYSLVRAEKKRGCLLTLAAVWESQLADLGQPADGILNSVRASE